MKPSNFDDARPRSSVGLKRSRGTSGKAKTGAIAALLFVLVAAGALALYISRGGASKPPSSSSSSKADEGDRVTVTIPETQSSHGTPPPDGAGGVSDAANRERIVPGSNLAPPTRDYSHNPVDAGQRTQGGGSYGSDMSGGGSPGGSPGGN